MRTPLSRAGGRLAFTLIELLTVIAIIAVLMALLLPTLRVTKITANKARAKNDLTQLVGSIRAFYTDYGTYPIDPSLEAKPQDYEYGATSAGEYSNADVVNVLRADPNSTDALPSGATPSSLNPHGVIYLDVPNVKDNTAPKSGLATTSTTGAKKAGEWFDPWGTPYIVAIDGNYDGYLSLGSALLLKYSDVNYSTYGGGNAVQAGAIGGSWGADKAQGAGGDMKFQGSDDVLSWQ